MTTTSAPTYRVLARKYRPQTLSEMVGQELLVKTLTQAINGNRLPHAFVLHGIRGVGKTTTARILAKALNCELGPTPDPCGTCQSCIAITEDRHLDVIEMDAASRTGVDDIREVIEAARYKAVNGRYKIYIIDEVHMLSRSAFNALLKTLEEPPPHTKFIFATTELKKIPDTVLSRCMRFDLSRIEPNTLMQHFRTIATAENLTIEDEALALIARAADGSARDGLSLLDQAIALAGGPVTAAIVQDMLGLVDRSQLFILMQLCLKGEIAEALPFVRDLYQRGSDPLVIIHDLLDLIYWVSCLKISPHLKHDITWPEGQRQLGAEIAATVSQSVLMRTWQVLSKGYEEVLKSPLPRQSLEMALMRLCYLSDLPSAEDLGKLLATTPTAPIQSRPMAPAIPMTTPPVAAPTPAAQPTLQPNPQSFEEVLKLVATAREPLLYSHLMQDAHLVSFAIGTIELRLNERAPKTLQLSLTKLLQQQTGQSWQITLSTAEGRSTIADEQKAVAKAEEQQIMAHETVQSLKTAFPQANVKISKI